MSSSKLLALVVALATTGVLAGSALAAAPENDSHMSPVQLSGRVDAVDGTNVEATKQPLEPAHAGNAGGASVWYRWTAPAAGAATVSTCDSDFNTLLAVYTGTGPVDSLNPVASNNDACGEQSRVEFTATAGEAYLIAVDGADGARGFIWLNVSLAPPNDHFNDAEVLIGNEGSVSSTTVGSSDESGEPAHAGNGSSSVWFAWIAPSSGWATFYTCGSPFDSVIAVYTGDSVGGLSLVAEDDQGCGDASRLSFEAVGGTFYRIAVAGYFGDSGDFTMVWNRFAPPPMAVEYPQVLGRAIDGETLTATEGVWSGAPPFTFTYWWGRCDRDFEDCEFIPGATSKTFTIRNADIGYRLWVRVMASNGTGPTEAFSDVTPVVLGRAPVNVLSPAVEGEARLGALLVASPGEWSGSAPITYSYQWQSCDATITACSNIAGQTGQVMRLTSVDLGDVIRVLVTASNVAGMATATSIGTDIERAVTGTRRRCVVPQIRGKSLKAAKQAIRRNRCRVGRIQRRFSGRARAGRVIAQTPRAGRRLAVGSRVHIVVSKGSRR